MSNCIVYINTFSLHTAAAETPVSLAEAKLHLNMLDAETYADTLITSLIKAATEVSQAYTWSQFVSATYNAYCSYLPEYFTIWKNPVSSITHIKYYDADNVQQTLATTKYEVYKENGITKIKILDAPVVYNRMDAIEIRMVCGYGAASAVPDAAKAAIKLTVGHLFEHREDVVIGTIVAKLDLGSQYLLDTVAFRGYL